MFAHFPKVLNMKKRLLVLAHREELLLQARDKFQSIDPELKAEIEQAASRAAADAKVVIASVPTLARNAARLSRLQPDEFSIIVVDEAHHSVAPSYRRIFDHFGLYLNGGDALEIERRAPKAWPPRFNPQISSWPLIAPMHSDWLNVRPAGETNGPAISRRRFLPVTGFLCRRDSRAARQHR